MGNSNKAGASSRPVDAFDGNGANDGEVGKAWDSREVPLMQLHTAAKALLAEGSSESSEEYQEIALQIRSILYNRHYLDDLISRIVSAAVSDPENRQLVLTTRPTAVHQPECHHRLVHSFNRHCFNFSKNSYAMKYGAVLANLCDLGDSGMDPEKLEDVIRSQCVGLDPSLGDIV